MPILVRLCVIAGLCSLASALAAEEPGAAHQLMVAGTVTRVFDGDNIEVQLGRKRVHVHLNGVDAPEPGQPWGKEATAALAQMVLNQAVDLEPVEPNRGGRMTAIVFVGEAEVGAVLVGDGNAWADRQDLRPSDTGLCEVEAGARDARRGLWSLPASQWIPPWEYRQRFTHIHRQDYKAETIEHCKATARKR
jgi:endonuclease YncB( thermonuclease family)